MCRHLSQSISHWSLWVSSQAKWAPIGLPTTFFPHTHTHSHPKVLVSSPIVFFWILAVVTVSETQKKRFYLNTVPGCTEMKSCYWQKEKSATAKALVLLFSSHGEWSNLKGRFKSSVWKPIALFFIYLFIFLPQTLQGYWWNAASTSLINSTIQIINHV